VGGRGAADGSVGDFLVGVHWVGGVAGGEVVCGGGGRSGGGRSDSRGSVGGGSDGGGRRSGSWGGKISAGARWDVCWEVVWRLELHVFQALRKVARRLLGLRVGSRTGDNSSRRSFAAFGRGLVLWRSRAEPRATSDRASLWRLLGCGAGDVVGSRLTSEGRSVSVIV
jgi:hypothetical protein